MRTPLHLALEQTAALYRAAGLRVAVDAAAINPPCVWLSLEQVRRPTLDGQSYAAVWAVTLVAPDAGQSAALRVFSDLDALAGPVLGKDNDLAELVGVQTKSGPILPGFRFTVTTVVTPDP